MPRDEDSQSGFGSGLRAHLTPHQPELGGVHPAEVETDARRRMLIERDAELGEREAGLSALERRLQREALDMRTEREALAARALEIERREAALAQDARPVRDVLRERAELFGERLWAVFDAALEAQHPDGRPDHVARVAAARALLREAYGEPARDDRALGYLPPLDELGSRDA